MWTFSVEESLGGLTESEEAFSLGSSLLDGDSREGEVSESLRTPSVASPGSLDEPVSREEEGGEEEEEFWKISEDTCKVHWDFSLDCQSLDRIEEI